MEALDLFQRALFVVICLSAPPLIAATVLGVGVSIVQGLFQVQDQTLSFTLKLAAVAAILYMTGAWMVSEIQLLAERSFELMSQVGR